MKRSRVRRTGGRAGASAGPPGHATPASDIAQSTPFVGNGAARDRGEDLLEAVDVVGGLRSSGVPPATMRPRSTMARRVQLALGRLHEMGG
jgi:hypothetical protein